MSDRAIRWLFLSALAALPARMRIVSADTATVARIVKATIEGKDA